MHLTIGDKVRVIENNEAGEIVAVIDENHAKVETFDEVITVHKEEVLPFSAACGYVCEPISKFEALKAVQHQEENKKKVKETPVTRLDLHAKKLMAAPENKSTEEILSIQISRLKDFLNQAVAANLKEVTVVHGKGSGRLKAEVHYILNKHAGVTMFKENDDFFSPNCGETLVTLQ